MICPTCGCGRLRVLETRPGEFGTIRRVRSCPLGHRFATREVHEPVWCSAKPRAREFAATVAARVALRARDTAIARALHAGWRALAARYGIDRATVYLAARRGRAYLKESTRA